MRVTIDRFEDCYAVCETEDRKMINIHKGRLPANTREGDILLLEDSGVISIDAAQTEKRKKEIESLMDELWEE